MTETTRSSISPTPSAAEVRNARKADSDPLELIAKRIGWLRIVFAVGTALLVAGAGAALYASGFQTREAASSDMQRHESSDGHPSLARGIEGLGARLIRVETLQQGAEITQKRMEDKLDVLLRLLYRLPSGGNAP